MQTQAMNSNAIAVDRRREKRRGKISFFSTQQLGINGRRERGRREEDRRGPVYVDRYDRGLVACILAVVILCALDAAFTLTLLSAGAVELNAFMAVLIEDNVSKFISMKLGLTSLALIFLLIHSDYRIGAGLRVRHLHYLVLACYSVLIIYELNLLKAV